uniref:Uncharacterized protein n=1 Tax=Arundo donax TaxID=35708 RepID=A0A0A8ZB13_ARUDO
MIAVQCFVCQDMWNGVIHNTYPELYSSQHNGISLQQAGSKAIYIRFSTTSVSSGL